MKVLLTLLSFRRWIGQERQVVKGRGEGTGLKKGVEEEDPLVKAGTRKIEVGLIPEVLQGGGMTTGAETSVGAGRLKG